MPACLDSSVSLCRLAELAYFSTWDLLLTWQSSSFWYEHAVFFAYRYAHFACVHATCSYTGHLCVMFSLWVIYKTSFLHLQYWKDTDLWQLISLNVTNPRVFLYFCALYVSAYNLMRNCSCHCSNINCASAIKLFYP